MGLRSPYPARIPEGRMLKNGTVAPRSPHHLRAASARKPHGLRTITVWRLRRLHSNSTEIARFLYNLRAASVRIYPGLPLRARTIHRMMLVDNVNTYAVARSHLRCKKKKTYRKSQTNLSHGARAKCELSISVCI